MWSFLRKRKTTQLIEEKRSRPKSLEQLSKNIGNFSDLSNHDAALKFWLPEPAKSALEEISQSNDQSVSSFLRQFLVIHCYGLYPYLIMSETIPNFCKDNNSGILFSMAAV
ncbi:hypothetical protein [Methylovulum miyakonense]|uniref:hypothetical protein n=1 Tax=Methylovulum miyakonense TaxID=645578 RepID=UPI00036EF0CB|nr:hypothetical protein [Methylovulum miyakonense]